MTGLPILAVAAGEYLLAASLRIVSPGVGTAIVLNEVASRTERTAFRAAVGSALGVATWGTLIALGLGAAMRSHAAVRNGVRMIGALYLLYLGLQSLGRAVAARRTAESSSPDVRSPTAFPLRRGFIAALLNPSLVAFFLLVAPQFVPSGTSVPLALVTFALVDATACFAWLALLASIAARALHRLPGARFGAATEVLAAASFIYFSIRLWRSHF